MDDRHNEERETKHPTWPLATGKTVSWNVTNSEVDVVTEKEALVVKDTGYSVQVRSHRPQETLVDFSFLQRVSIVVR